MAQQLLGTYDFYSPFASAAIVNRKSGKRYALTPAAAAKGADPNNTSALKLNGLTAGGAKEFSLDVLPFLSQVTVKIDAGVVPYLTATLTPPLEIARALMSEGQDVFEWGGISDLEIQFGYSAGMGTSKKRAVSPTYRGLIMQPNFSYSGDDFTITFEAQGAGGWALATTSGGSTALTGTFFSIIEELCKKLNVTVEKDTDDPTNALLERKLESLPVGTYSYFSTIYDLARRCGCYVYLEDTDKGSKLTVRSVGKIVLGTPVGTLAMLGGFNGSIGPESGVWPILSVSTNHTAIFLSSAQKALFKANVNEKGEIKKTVVAPEKDAFPTVVKGATGRESESSRASDKPANTGKQDEPSDQLKMEIVNTYLQSTMNKGAVGMQLEVETLGFPEVSPGMILTVQGLGTRFDGNFVVQEVEHEFSTSGMSTNLTLIQNASHIWNALKGVFPTLEPNTSTAATPAPGAAGSTVTVTSKDGK